MSEINTLSELINKVNELEEKITVLGGKIDGLGENLWDMKTEEEWANIGKTIEDIMGIPHE